MRFATLSDHIADDKPTAIDRAAPLGFAGLELVVPDGVHDVGAHGMALDADHPPVEDDPVWTASGRADLRDRAAEQDLALPSICPSFINMSAGLVAPAKAERTRIRERLTDLIDATAALGGETILVPFFRAATIENETQRERVVTELQTLAPRAATAGVTLAIETTLDAAANRAIVEAVDHPAVGVYYDVANVLDYGYDPADEIRALGDEIVQVHFKDIGDDGGHVRLGEGRVPYDRVADALTAVGYDGWIALETSYRRDRVDTMAANLAFARELVG